MARAYVKAPEILCWTCRKACGGCSWADSFTPVEGWEAVPNVSSTGEIRGYDIQGCPEYEPDPKEPEHTKLLDHEGVMLLMEAVARRMREDYIFGHGPVNANMITKKSLKMRAWEIDAVVRKENRKLIERWLRSQAGMQMLQLSNPEEVIGMLRKYALKYELERQDAAR